MNRASRTVASLVLALLLTACQEDIYAPENLGKLSVALEITGLPAGDESFVVEWTDLDSPAHGAAPFTPNAARQTFDQVPLGPTQAALRELPSNCGSEQNIKSTEVVRHETREIRFSIRCR